MNRAIGIILIFLAAVGLSVATSMWTKRSIQKNPDFIFKAIKDNPSKFIEVVTSAAELARKDKEEKELETVFENPLKPIIRSDENIRGNPSAPITLVEYSDFECPYCSRAVGVIEALMKKYNNNIRFVYKHLPLSFHPKAMLAAQYYEGVRLQSGEKAWAFHDELLKSVSKVKLGEKYFLSIAKKLKVNLAKLKKDIKSEAVKKRIADDMKEAELFDIRGTPGFVINGIPVKGALPVSYFDNIIDKLKKRGDLDL